MSIVLLPFVPFEKIHNPSERNGRKNQDSAKNDISHLKDQPAPGRRYICQGLTGQQQQSRSKGQ
jgi:hypothetical protein